MATKTFSSRTSESDLAYMDAPVRAEFGMSYGQYCGSILIDAIRSGEKLPQPRKADEAARRASAVESMKAFSLKHRNVEIGSMTDGEIKQLIASRYE